MGYLQNTPSGLHDLATAQTKKIFVLTDENRPGAIWHNEIFSLHNHLDAVELFSIDAPNGVETFEGGPFIWLNNQFADLMTYSDADRQALFAINECLPGPSLPGDANRTLIVEVNGAKTEVPASSNLKVPINLNQGVNLVRLSCKEHPTAGKLSSGDTRTLLLGIKGFRFAKRENIELLAIDAPNRVETVQGDPFIWLNNQFTDMKIVSDADRQSFLRIRECWSGPSRPGDTDRTLIVEVNGERVEVPAAPNLKVPLKLNQGNNLVRLSCKETPTVDKLSSGDTRTLLLGIKGFRLASRDEPVEVSAIEAPNQVETVQGDPFIWLNNQFTDLTIRSDADREAFLMVRECWPGPSRPEGPNRTLIVEVNGAKVEVPAAPNLTVPLKLNQGDNHVRLSCKETPTVGKLSSGDTRTLLLGIKGFNVKAAD
jgi:hypothetical protein